MIGFMSALVGLLAFPAAVYGAVRSRSLHADPAGEAAATSDDPRVAYRLHRTLSTPTAPSFSRKVINLRCGLSEADAPCARLSLEQYHSKGIDRATCR